MPRLWTLPIRSRRSVTGSCSRIRDLIYLDGNSLGRAPGRHARPARRRRRPDWGEQLVSGWHDWIDAARARRRPARPSTCSARPPGEVMVGDSTTVNLYKLACAALDARAWPPASIVTDGDNFPTDRYVLEGLAAQRGLRAAADQSDRRRVEPGGGRARSTARRAGRLLATSTTAPARSPTWPRSPPAHAPARCRLGPVPLGRRGPGRPRRERRRARRRLHLQVPERAARARPPSSTSPRRCRRRCARRSGAGSASATSSRWSGATTRSTASGASWPARRRSSALAAVEEGARLLAEAGIARSGEERSR